jgi:hypothetical protein
MQKEKENRVLGRLGARELTPEEVERAKGKGSVRGPYHSDSISLNPVTLTLDGDAIA